MSTIFATAPSNGFEHCPFLSVAQTHPSGKNAMPAREFSLGHVRMHSEIAAAMDLLVVESGNRRNLSSFIINKKGNKKSI